MLPPQSEQALRKLAPENERWGRGSRHRWVTVGNGQEGAFKEEEWRVYVTREGRSERKQERIKNGEGRGSQRQSHALFAKMDKEGCSVCAEDLHTDPAQPRPGRGGMAELQGGAGADPSEGQLRCQRQGTHPQDLPKYWIFL